MDPSLTVQSAPRPLRGEARQPAGTGPRGWHAIPSDQEALLFFFFFFAFLDAISWMPVSPLPLLMEAEPKAGVSPAELRAAGWLMMAAPTGLTPRRTAASNVAPMSLNFVIVSVEFLV